MPPTPLTEEDIVPPELPENTAGIINLLIDAMKLGAYEFRARSWQVEHAIAPPPFDRAALHEIDQLCHRLGVASGTPSWYWLELIMDRPALRPPVAEVKDERDPACVARWPGCESGLYDQRCCRFPKSCSPTRPGPLCAMEPGCTNPQYEGGPACAEHTF